MKLRSVSKPKSEPTEKGGAVGKPKPTPISEKISEAPASAPPPMPEGVRRRLVFGKRSDTLSPPPSMVGLESVFGPDERTRLVTTEEFPHKLVCALEIDAPWGAFVGTAWFVGPRTLITAGHCVFDAKQMGGWAREIVVTPGRNRDLKPFGSFTATQFSTIDPWIERQDPDFDMAAIHLDKAVFGETDVFRVGALPDTDLEDYMVNVSGYPAEPGGGTELWWARNRIKAVTPRRIFYDVDTSGGQSGAPVYILPDETAHPIVVGIHAYGEGGTPANISLRVNSAPRIIPEVVEQIEKWRQADGAPAAVA